jgi:V-type H+-transporting ATPase subunit C
MRNIDGDLKK